jgi:hypothetical protein
MRALACACAAVFLFACGKTPEAAKSADQIKSERDEAARRTRENPVYGEQLKALDKAKSIQETINKQGEELRKKEDAESR